MELFRLLGVIAIDSSEAESAIDDIGDRVSGLGSSLQESGKAIGKVGGKMTKTFTVAGTAIGGFALKAAADFESAMSEVGAISGASGDDLKKLEEKAKSMGATTKFSATESAEALKYMAMAGWKTEDMLGGLEGIMNLAAASGENLGTTSDIVTDALTAFGLTAADSGHFADILAAASSNANTNVSMMGETFKYVAPVAGALGYSAEDTAEAIGLMANAGIKSSQAGTSLRSILSNLQGEVKFTGAGFGEMAVQTTKADGSMKDLGVILNECRKAFAQMSESERAANAEAVVGREAMSGFLALMTAAPKDIEKVSSAISGCGGAAKTMADTMNDNLSGQIVLLKSQLEGLAIQFVSLIMPYLKQGVEWLSKVLTWVSNLDDGTKKLILTIGGIVVVAGPVLKVVGSVVSGIGGLVKAGGILIGGIGKLVPAVSGIAGIGAKVVGGIGSLAGKIAGVLIPAISSIGGPVLIVIGVIGGLVAAGVALYKHWDELRAIVGKIWEGIKNAVSAAVEAIKGFLSVLGTALLNIGKSFIEIGANIVSGLWEGITSGFTWLIEKIKNIFHTIIDAVKSLFGIHSPSKVFAEIGVNIMQGLIEGLGGFLQNVLEVVGTIVGSIIDGFKALAEGIKEKFIAAKDAAVQKVLEMKDALVEKATELKERVTEKFHDIKEAIVEKFTGLRESVAEKFNAMKEGAIEAVNDMREKVVEKYEEIKGQVTDKINELKEATVERFNELKEKAAERVSEMRDKVSETVASMKEKVGAKFSELVSGASECISGLHDAVVGKFTEVKEKAVEAIGNLKERAVEKFGEIKEGVAEKIDGLKGFVVDTFGEIAEKAGSKLAGLADKVSSIFNNIKSAASAAMSSFGGTIMDTVSSAGTAIKDKLGGAGEAIGSAFEKVGDKISGSVEKAKGLFDMDWKLPEIKTPHFSVGGTKEVFGLKLPDIDVDWYAEGGVMTKPTAFGIDPNTGRLQAGGEAGPEAVAPISVLQDYVRTAVNEANGELAAQMATACGLLGQLLDTAKELAGMGMVLDTGAMVGALAVPMSAAIGQAVVDKRRGR